MSVTELTAQASELIGSNSDHITLRYLDHRYVPDFRRRLSALALHNN